MEIPIPLPERHWRRTTQQQFPVSRAIETAIKAAQGEDEPVSGGGWKVLLGWAWIATVERAPKAQGSNHSDFKEPSSGRRTAVGCTRPLVQMHPHHDAETLDDIVVTFSGQDGVQAIEAWT